MSAGPQSYASRRDTVVFLACLFLAVVARAAPSTVSERISSLMRRSVLAPLITLQRQTELLQRRRSDIDRLISERDSLSRVAAEVSGLESENERLRTILRLRPRMGFRHVAAEVLHQLQPADFATLLVTAGSREDVRRWAPVVAPEGLVGTVQIVDPRTSVVHAWTHPDFRASAVSADGTVIGIVAPRIGSGATTFLELREVPHVTQVVPGSMIVTSGRGGVFPRGIPLGRLGPMIDEEEGFTKTYLVEPAVALATVSHVLILLADVDDVTRVFAPS